MKQQDLIFTNLKCLLTFHHFSSSQLIVYSRTIYPHKDFSECGRKQKIVSGSHCILKYNLLTVFRSPNKAAWRCLEECFPNIESLASRNSTCWAVTLKRLLSSGYFFFFATFCLVLNKTDCITVREKFKLLLIWVLIYQKYFLDLFLQTDKGTIIQWPPESPLLILIFLIS